MGKETLVYNRRRFFPHKAGWKALCDADFEVKGGNLAGLSARQAKSLRCDVANS